ACVLLVGAGGLCLFWVLLCLRVMDCVAAPLFGCFSRGFFICGKDHGCSLLFWPRRFEGENVLFLDNGQAAHCFLVCGGCLSVFVRFLGLSLFFDSSDLKGF
ncbi:hypothetical protein, partial [Corynebacterium amycolatum]|uniref:hypothetical protein n=1 Tax=Corynebacterium amycolatum TaxID=43765 RepID=UPI00234D54F9